MPDRKTKRSNDTGTKKCRMSTITRLATPKCAPPTYLSNRPSVYWLDYLETNEALRLKTPFDLQQYYNRFYANLPRLLNLSQPKPSPCSRGYPRPDTGVPSSALNYSASPRIKLLSQPRSYDYEYVTNPNISESYPRPVKTAGDPYSNSSYGDSNRFPSSSTGNFRAKSTEMHEENVPSRLPPQYSRFSKPNRPPYLPKSQSVTYGSTKQPESANRGLKNRDHRKNTTNRTRLPPLTNQSDNKLQRKQPRKKSSKVRLPDIDTDEIFY